MQSDHNSDQRAAAPRRDLAPADPAFRAALTMITERA
jgi:hypothetical protein